jgi:glycerol-3-phosphate O-acyltransferase
LRRHDLLFYIEGGRSYSGELKPAKTGLVQASLQAACPDAVVVPTAIAYDLVLEDRSLARQGVKRRQRPFSAELAEMVRQAVGYRSRAFVTFGDPIRMADYDGTSRRAVLDLAHRVRREIGRLYKVLPSALVASAMRPSTTRQDLEGRVSDLVERLDTMGANLLTSDAGEAVSAGIDVLAGRQIIVSSGGRLRVRDRFTLRYYGRTIAHLVEPAADR